MAKVASTKEEEREGQQEGGYPGRLPAHRTCHSTLDVSGGVAGSSIAKSICSNSGCGPFSAWPPPRLCPCLCTVAVAAGHLPETHCGALSHSPLGMLRLHGKRFNEFQVRERPVPVLVVGEPGGSSKGAMGGSQGRRQDGSIAVGKPMQVLLVGPHQCRGGKVLIAAAGDSATRKQVLESFQKQQLLDDNTPPTHINNQLCAALEYVQIARSLWLRLFSSAEPPLAP